MEATSIDLGRVIEEINRLSGLHFRVLSFSPPLEAHFEAQTRHSRCRRLWLEGLLATFIYTILLFVCQRDLPDVASSGLVSRLLLVTPAALLVNLLMLFNPSKGLRETAIAFIAVVLGLALICVAYTSKSDTAILAQFGVAVALIFVNSVMRLRVLFAMGASLLLGLGEIVLVLSRNMQKHHLGLTGVGLTLATLLFSSIANYSHNREERLNFLLCIRGDLLINKLSRTNDDLTLEAEQDALTGLANRRAFDRRLADAWREASDHGSMLAIILLDIDHFKQLNDTFGHLYGDKVLRRIGRLLQETLRQKADVVARFGGEEFVVLLPGTSLEGALLVAERMRKLIELAGLPGMETNLPNQNLSAATVSCGVAVGSPMQYESSQQMLELADKALYQAKRAGRNLVCRASLDGTVDFASERQLAVSI